MQRPSIQFVTPKTTAELDATRQIFREYSEQLDVDLWFQNFEDEMISLPGDYQAPTGALLLAMIEDQVAGCCALRKLESVNYAQAAEMKRLFVRPLFRGIGLGKQLAETALDAARTAGYDCVLLDTLDSMEAARKLYVELGFAKIPPYYDNPITGVHYLKVNL